MQIAQALTSLHKHFGFDDFREGQRAVISAVLAGKNVVVVMPTGSGKSLCFQLPAMMLEGATVVVSPLIALMKDQVDALQARGLPATFINSSISDSEQRARIEGLRRGDFKLVYVAPERFRSPRFVNALRSIRLALFSVDEAHCVSTWGHDFRPDYLRLRNAIEALGGVQTLALTATATPYVRADLIKQLGIKLPEIFVSGFDRPNLSIDVVHTQRDREKLARIRQIAQSQAGSGIIYTATRKAVEQVTNQLKQEGLNVAPYHAGMTDSVRIRSQESFMSGKTQMIVATNAFGMGIDKPDIRFVVHYQMPGSLEAFYQEIGRAGRDGLPAKCTLLFNYADKNTHDFFIEGSYPGMPIVADVYNALAEVGQGRIELSLSEIAARSNCRNEMAVQSSLYLLERAGHIQRVHSGGDNPYEKGGSQARSSRRARAILMLDAQPVAKLRVNAAEVMQRARLEQTKLREMILFCYTEQCYRAHILNYFGDRNHERKCGACGNCAPSGTVRARPAPESLVAESTKVSAVLTPRLPSEDESLRVRKILACAARMRGRFGKSVLAGTLRGSAARKILNANLNELTTYGLLRDMRQEELLIYVEALISAGCLRVSKAAYPTVAITELGERVMREQERVELLLPAISQAARA
jgi:ATP-dependent DNA helicase RecQ